MSEFDLIYYMRINNIVKLEKYEVFWRMLELILV